MLELKPFQTTKYAIVGIETIHIIKKGQILQREKSVQNQIKLIHQLFEVTS